MMKKLVVTIVVLVAIVGIAFAAYSNTNTKNSVSTTNSTSSDKASVSVKNTASNTAKTESNISPAKAQSIATTYIEVSGATAGTPKLVNQDGTLIYIVPIIDTNNKTVGEIDIDAKTGKNVGGAGGAP